MRAIFTFLALATALGAQQQAPVKTDCAVDGYVVDSVTGEPVPRARVMLVGLIGQTVAADNSGHWSFSNAACGQFQIGVTRPGFVSANPGGQRFPYMTSGSPVHDVKVQLTPQSVILGRVVDDQGDPIMNAQVVIFASRVVEGRRTFQPAGSVNTNDLGEFRLAGLRAGKYVVCAHANEQAPGDSVAWAESCYPGPVEAGSASAMELAPGHETPVGFTLNKVPTVHVRGVISGAPKSQGVGISVIKRGAGMKGGQGGVQSARAGPDGKFDLAGVTPGSYMLYTDYFEADTHLTARVPVEVGNSDVNDIAVHLDSGFAMTGRVRFDSKSDNAPVNRQFAVNLRSSEPMVGGGPIKWSADNATFTFPDVTPGNYRLDAFPPSPFYVKSAALAGRDILREEIPITQSGAGPIDIVLSDDGGAIDVQVNGADDQPVVAAVMFLQDGLPPRIPMTGPDGHVKLQGLAPGDYRIYAWDDVQQVEYADAEWMKRYGGGGVSVTVQAGQTAQVTVKQQTAPAQ